MDRFFYYSSKKVVPTGSSAGLPTVEETNNTGSTTLRKASHTSLDPLTPQIDVGPDLKKLKSYIKHLDALLGVLALSSMLVSSSSENYFFDKGYTSDRLVIILRSFVSLATVFMIMMLCSRYSTTLKLLNAKRSPNDLVTLWSTGLYKKLAAELAVVVIHCPPGLDSTFEASVMNYSIEYSMDSFLSVFVLLRFYLCLRLIYLMSDYTSQRAEWVLHAHGLEVSSIFAVKAYIATKPLIAVGALFVLGTLFWSELLFLAEKPERKHVEMMCESSKVYHSTEHSDLNDFGTCYWLTFVTTATVGYGEVYPKTNVGRAVAMLACILGNVYTGLLVLALQSNLKLNQVEEKASRYMVQRHLRHMLEKTAARAFIVTWRLSRLHTQIKHNYKLGHMLKPFSIMPAPRKLERSLLPVKKVFGSNCASVADIRVLREDDYMRKLLYIRRLWKCLGSIKHYKRMLFNNIGTSALRALNEGFDIEMDLIEKQGYKTLRIGKELRHVASKSASIKSKARQLKRLSASLVKQSSSPVNFRVNRSKVIGFGSELMIIEELDI